MEVVQTLNLNTSVVETLNPKQIHQGCGDPKLINVNCGPLNPKLFLGGRGNP